jgi:choline dehydrogenase-like flavoprotein
MGIGETPIMSVTVGRNVGGSSVHTGGVCFRIPGSVHREWVNARGLPELSERELEKAYEAVERRVNVTTVPVEDRSRSTEKFVQGAEKLGVTMQSMRRNTVGCEGLARCNFGCPKGHKMSVDVSFLPAAVKNGTRVVSDALVERLIFEGDRVVGVEGRLLHNAQKKRIRARAPVVVLACGTLHSPLLLEASGVSSKHVGKHITLHPSARVCAFFDEKINGWDGALQSVFTDAYASEGITINGVYSPVSVLAAGMPGFGPHQRRLVQSMPNVAVIGGMVHDEGGGAVYRAPAGREGVLTYEMAPRDLLRLRRSMVIMGEMAFAAGAREVTVPIFGVGPVRDVATLRRLQTDPLDAQRIECIAFHPLGSARMANDARRGVTSSDGAVFGTRGLYVADGSVLPSSIGVNSQLPIMAMATRIAWLLRDRTKH